MNSVHENYSQASEKLPYAVEFGCTDFNRHQHESVELMPYFIEWRKAFPGESIVFDYYFMWDCYRDLGRVQTSRIIHEDVKNYKDMNITGLISCQAQRVFASTSLGMNIMARTLWNRECDFEAEMEVSQIVRICKSAYA